MKSIAIVTDSNCGMSPAQAKDLGIYMLPMPFFIDDKEYLEDIDMNQSEFFQHLEQNPGCRVSTSQPTPESVTTLWDKLLKDYDEIVHIPMSSGLSSSMQTARMLAENYDGRVRVVNNPSAHAPSTDVINMNKSITLVIAIYLFFYLPNLRNYQSLTNFFP